MSNLTQQQIEIRAKEITNYLYEFYGSGTGVLLGIPPHCKEAVYHIVRLTLERMTYSQNKSS
ncbi:MAG: hypothetical protein AABY22_03440 [Nanoarchaeota archaeon]